jgi:hypothetical protein
MHTTAVKIFFNNQFLNAINRRQNIDFGLSWDKEVGLRWNIKLN